MELRRSKVLKRKLRNLKLKGVSEATGINISLRFWPSKPWTALFKEFHKGIFGQKNLLSFT